MSLSRFSVSTLCVGRSVRTGALLALALAVVGPALTTSGCLDSTGTATGDECLGGVILDGQCQAKCDPAKCLDGNVCVNNQCRLVCVSHRQCNWPIQACLPTEPEDVVEGAALPAWLASASGVCTEVGRYPVPGMGGWGTACPVGNECSAWACPNGLECEPLACWDGVVGHPDQCLPDPLACAGTDPCNIGICQGTGAPCTVTTCAPNECTPFFCKGVGFEGDMLAYCTHYDCSADDDCPAGWSCGAERDPHDICGPICDGDTCDDGSGRECETDGDCQKGNNGTCGETAEPCVDLAVPAPDGRQYVEGPACLMRRVCMPREQCTPCTHNRDCSLERGQLCAPIDEGAACMRMCSTDLDCVRDQECVPTYPTCDIDANLPCPNVGCPPLPCVNGQCVDVAGAPIGIGCQRSSDCPAQACVERRVCVPRAGQCGGPNVGFCGHCVDDRDCGTISDSSRWTCVELSFGERACQDVWLPDTCPGGSESECPVSPSGDHGYCLDEYFDLTPADWAYHRCDVPYDSATNRWTCWL